MVFQSKILNKKVIYKNRPKTFYVNMFVINQKTNIMKNNLLKFFAIAGILLFSQFLKAGHLQDNLLFSAKIDGNQEVPPVSTDAIGVASFMLNSTREELCINVAVNELSGAITGAHIHQGAIGTNGGVILDLGAGIDGNQITLTVSGSDLTPSLISELLLGTAYINIHTAANPNGEIRGQISLESDWSFIADANGMQEVPPVSTSANGLGVFTLSKDNSTMSYKFIAQGLSGAITGAHLHEGAAGANGGVVVDLTTNVMGNVIMGSFTPTSSFLTNLLNESIYINIHTAANPNGEIRGQLSLNTNIAFDSSLDGAQEVPPVSTTAQGVATLSINTMFNEIEFDIVVDGLSGAITGAHLHEGAVGANGGVIIDFTSNIDGNRITGSISGGAVTNSLINSLLTGETYINIHTASNPNGEIRGQVFRLAREGYTTILNGSQEVPPVSTSAYGAGVVSINRDQNNLHYMFVVGDLSGTNGGVHFHNAAEGANGGVIFDLTDAFMGTGTSDSAFGYWTSADTTPFTPAQSQLFRNNEVYINVHTANNPSGEIRGQINAGQQCYTTLSIGDINSPSNIYNYPNPFTNVINLELSPEITTFSVEILNITGQVIYSEQYSNNGSNLSIDASSITRGIYILNIKQNNKYVSSQKIIKN